MAEENTLLDSLSTDHTPNIETPAALGSLVETGLYTISLQCNQDTACQSIYTYARQDSSNGQLLTTDYRWNAMLNRWQAVDETQAQRAATSLLTDGEWVRWGGMSLVNGLSQNADSSASVTAVEIDLSNMPVAAHMQERQAQGHRSATFWFDSDTNNRFDNGSAGYRLKLEERRAPYVLLHYNERSGASTSNCEHTAGNCNVINTRYSSASAEGSAPASRQTLSAHSLESIRAMMSAGVDISNPGFMNSGFVKSGLRVSGFALNTMQAEQGDDGAIVRLSAKTTSDDTLPLQGEAIWASSFITKLLLNCDKSYAALTPDAMELGLQQTPEPVNFQALDDCGNVIRPGMLSVSAQSRIVSSWRLITVDDVQMIRISLPLELRDKVPENNYANALLLIEQDGLVRLGAMAPSARAYSLFAYNERALYTLQEIAIRKLQALQ